MKYPTLKDETEVSTLKMWSILQKIFHSQVKSETTLSIILDRIKSLETTLSSVIEKIDLLSDTRKPQESEETMLQGQKGKLYDSPTPQEWLQRDTRTSKDGSAWTSHQKWQTVPTCPVPDKSQNETKPSSFKGVGTLDDLRKIWISQFLSEE